MSSNNWIGSGTLQRRNFDRCHGNEHQFGKSMRILVLDFKQLSPKLCVLRLKGRFFILSLINIHAPTEDKSEDFKDAHDIKIVPRDCKPKERMQIFKNK